MTKPQVLAVIRTVHTVIYVVMASCVFLVLYAGITGAHGAWLWAAGGWWGSRAWSSWAAA